MNAGGFYAAVFFNLWHAFLSACVWTLIWIVAFFGSNIVIEASSSAKVVATATALSLTFAVFSGHIAKLISYAVGCDTDFRHIFIRDERRDAEQPKFVRLVFSILFLAIAIFFVWQDLTASNNTVPIVSTNFFLYSMNFKLTILSIFFAQLVFSWPDAKEVKVEEES